MHIYERLDFSTKLYGAIIYPEHIKTALLNRELAKFLTGKFSMQTKRDKKLDEYLEINAELKPGEHASKIFKQKVCSVIIDTMLKKNAEYQYLHQHMSNRIIPRINILSHGDEKYFRNGVKQKWAVK